MTSCDSIGTMDGAYFVSKRDLLEWLRHDFELNIAKIEDCGNGVTYIKILDRLYPGRVPLKKVKLNAKQEWECLYNLKILQTVFQDCGVRKHVDIDRLSKCQYLDNLEFLQWLKCFYDRFVPAELPREDTRLTSLGNSTSLQMRIGTQSSGTSNTRPISRSAISTSNSRLANGTVKGRLDSNSSSNRRPVSGNIQRSIISPQCLSGAQRTFSRNGDEVAKKDDEILKLKEELDAYKKELRAMQVELENTEKESHFYFGKLRRLELMSTEENRTNFEIHEVQAILFTEEDLPEVILQPSEVENSHPA